MCSQAATSADRHHFGRVYIPLFIDHFVQLANFCTSDNLSGSINEKTKIILLHRRKIILVRQKTFAFLNEDIYRRHYIF